MRIITKQFSQLAPSTRAPGTRPTQPKANLKGYAASYFGVNRSETMREVNTIISLILG